MNSAIRQTGKQEMYLPQLSLEGSEFSELKPAATTASDIEQNLTETISPNITVSVVNRKAVLHGVVDSEKNRRLAGILASFEPGVSAVRNDLTVADAESSPPPLPAPDHR